MCDYSLESYKSRKAIAGEDLVLRTFPSRSKGFVAAADFDKKFETTFWGGVPKDGPCAVCCEPGMTMTVHLEGNQPFPGATGEAFDVDVTFASAYPGAGTILFHRDGVTLLDGKFVSLQDLAEGTRATVIKPLPESLTKALDEPLKDEPELRNPVREDEKVG